MAGFRFTCGCGRFLEVPLERRGRRVRCPACARVVVAENVLPAAARLVDPGPAAIPPTPWELSAQPWPQKDDLGGVWGDFMLPVVSTWVVLIGLCLWRRDGMGALPAQVMFVAYTAGLALAWIRLPRHLSMSLTDRFF